MKYRKNVIISILSICTLCTIFMVSCTKLIKPISKETYMLGTIIDIKVYDKKGNEVIDKCINRIRDIEEKMSVNKPKSEVNTINNSSGRKSERVSDDTYYVIKKALEYSYMSKGAFDITIEPLVKIWGIGTDKARVPLKEEIEKALKYINYKDIEASHSNEVYLKRKGMAIDLGGIAKGYAADELKKIIKEENIKSAFLNLGGNVYAIGSKQDGSPWNIGIQNPLKGKGEYMGILSVKDKSVVTSGNYERYFMKNGKRYHHIFDPKTGYPSEQGLISTTIVSDSSIDGDALSTTTYVLGLQKGMELIKSLKGVEAVFITDNKKVYVTEGLKDSFKLTSEEFKYEKGR